MFYCYLSGNFIQYNTYSFCLIFDYIININEINTKQIYIHSYVINMKFLFKYYK